MAEPGEAPRAPQQAQRALGDAQRVPQDGPRASPDGPSAGEVRLFCLRVGAARYALDASLVAEVVRLGPLTRLPAAPGWLPGVLAHRGEVLAVLDLSRLLGQPAASLAAGVRAAVIRAGEWRLAVVADAVEGLSTVDGAALEPPPAEGAGPVSAVGRDGRGPLALLDMGRVVAAARSWSQPA